MIHGDRSQSQRTAALTGFQRGQYRVLVATDVAARGIHVQDIAHVINYDLPEVAENFIHRVDGTGRAGERGVASTLFVREQWAELFQLERALGIRMERVSMNGGSCEKSTRTHRPSMERIPATFALKLVPLPGELLQVQMEG
jgi:superfamily II DNA/RNA helicase